MMHEEMILDHDMRLSSCRPMSLLGPAPSELHVSCTSRGMQLCLRFHPVADPGMHYKACMALVHFTYLSPLVTALDDSKR